MIQAEQETQAADGDKEEIHFQILTPNGCFPQEHPELRVHNHPLPVHKREHPPPGRQSTGAFINNKAGIGLFIFPMDFPPDALSVKVKLV